MPLEQVLAFIQERWFVIVIAIIALFIIIKVVKTILKWVLVIAIIAGVIYYGANYVEDITQLKDAFVTEFREQAYDVLAKEASEATYQENPDGTFIVESKNVLLEGKKGSTEVKINIRGLKATLEMNEYIENFIQAAKKNAKISAVLTARS